MFKLIIQDDEGKTTVVPLIRDEITIGRKEGNTIRLTERNVSRKHARLVKNNGSVVIEDLDSYNGIRVNGTRIAGRVSVAETDRIQIGDYLLELKLDRAGTPPPGGASGQYEEQRTQPMERLDVQAAPNAPTQPLPSGPTVPSGAPAGMLAKTLPANGAPVPLVGDGDPTLRHESRHPAGPVDPAAGAATAPGMTPAPGAAPGADVPARLVCMSTNFAGKDFSLDKPAMVIGRTDDNDIVVNHRSISRHHAKVVREHGRYAIVDLQSSNGVRVNGEEYGKVELRRGDLVDLGHVRLRFVEPGEDFVFDRDGTVVDLSAEPMGGKSKTPIYVVAALLVVGAIVAILVIGGGKKKPSAGPTGPAGGNLVNTAVDAGMAVAALPPDAALPAVPVGPAAADVEKKLVVAREAVDSRDWSGALAASNEALVLDPSNTEAKGLADTARRETENMRTYDDFGKAAKAGHVEEAAKLYQKIPDDSVYKALGDTDLQKAGKTWLDQQMAFAKQFADRGQCDKIAPLQRKVQELFPDADAVSATLDKSAARCLAKRDGQKEPKDPPPKEPKDPPPKEPKDPPPVFDQGKFDALAQEARGAYLNGQYGVAIKKADEALAMKGNDDGALLTGGMSACKLKNADKAKKYSSRLGSPAKKNALKQLCAEAGVDL